MRLVIVGSVFFRLGALWVLLWSFRRFCRDFHHWRFKLTNRRGGLGVQIDPHSLPHGRLNVMQYIYLFRLRCFHWLLALNFNFTFVCDLGDWPPLYFSLLFFNHFNCLKNESKTEFLFGGQEKTLHPSIHPF